MGKSGGFKGSGATGFDGVPLSGSTLSRRIIACEGVTVSGGDGTGGGKGENDDEEF